MDEEVAIDDTGAWRAACDGDPQAFGTLFDRHRHRVFRHASRLVPSPHDAEDVTAAAFLELWRRRQSARLVDGSVLPWLLVTATNVASNLRRGTRRHRDFLARLPREDTAPDTAAIAMARTLTGMEPELETALRRLPRRDLHLLTLVALEGFSISEAARVLGVAEATARSRLHRARQRARLAVTTQSTRTVGTTSHGGPG